MHLSAEFNPNEPAPALDQIDAEARAAFANALAASPQPWADWDVAAHLLGVALGLFPPGGSFAELKHVFWTSNALGESLHERLAELAEAGVVRKREEPDIQFRAISSPLRIAVLNCEDADEWGDLCAVLSAAFGAESDVWTEFRAWRHEFPTDAELQQLDAVVCPGSRHSANDDSLDWIAPLLDALRRVAAAGSAQLLAVGFGHQALARALGGTVARNPSNLFRYFPETITCVPGWCAQLAPPGTPSAVEGASKEEEEEEELVLLESHGDCVSALPPAARCLASSPGSAHEIYAVGTNVLSFQAHPEFTGELMNSRVWTAVSVNGTLSGTAAEKQAARNAVAQAELSNARVRGLISAFLRRR